MQELEDRIVGRMTKHFDSQVNWLNKNFEEHTKSIHLQIEVGMHAHEEHDNKRFDSLQTSFKILKTIFLEKQFAVQARTVLLSVGIALLSFGAIAWAIS